MMFFIDDNRPERNAMKRKEDPAKAALYKKEIIKRINSLSGSRSPYEVFCDWVKCSALCCQNYVGNVFPQFRDRLWEQREAEYVKTIHNFGKEAEAAANAFAEMTFSLLPMAMQENMSDILGEIYMEAGIGNKNTGQFFTPFHVSYMCAQAAMKDEIAEWDGKVITMSEPSCGAGGMVIAAAKVLLDHGINPQLYLKVTAQDLDWKAVYMCYLQLSVLGLKAKVIQGDTLTKPYVRGYPPERVFRTFPEMGLPVWLLEMMTKEAKPNERAGKPAG